MKAAGLGLRGSRTLWGFRDVRFVSASVSGRV